jgi:hypothetical protein
MDHSSAATYHRDVLAGFAFVTVDAIPSVHGGTRPVHIRVV